MLKSKIFKIVKGVIGGKGLTKYESVRKMKKIAEENLHSKYVNIDEHKIFLDSSDSLRLSINGDFEPHTTKLIKNNISKGNLVIDVGANIGYFSLIMAKCVENGKVFSFEPELKNFELLEKNLDENEYSNVVLENKAVGNKNGITEMYLADKNDNIYSSSMHKIFSSKIVSQLSNTISVNIIKLDEYFVNLGLINKIDLVKIDVEGAEFDVLRGMEKIIDGNKNIKIIMEFCLENLEDFGSNPKDIMHFLKDKGFKIWKINEIEKNLQQVFEINDLMTLEKEKTGLNIFCSR